MYISFEELKVLFLLWIGIILMLIAMKKHHVVKIATATTFIFAILLNLFMAISYSTNIEAFDKRQQLECNTSHSQYLVSKETGWKHSQKYFIKNDLMIRVVDCKEL